MRKTPPGAGWTKSPSPVLQGQSADPTTAQLTATYPLIAAVDLNPFADAFLEDPYPYHHVLRDAGAVVWLPSISAYGMARYAEVKAALTDHMRAEPLDQLGSRRRQRASCTAGA